MAPSAVLALTAETFDEEVLGAKGALVEFYAPWLDYCLFTMYMGVRCTTAQSRRGILSSLLRARTNLCHSYLPALLTQLLPLYLTHFHALGCRCGHCKSLAPKYEKLALAFAGETDVLIAKVDATENPDLANKYEVTGYPTIKFFAPGSSEAESYEGARELEDMIKFINEKVGTQRASDGSLLPTAGRVEVLDELLTKLNFKIEVSAVEQLKNAAKALEGRLVGYGKQYVAIAEKLLAKGEDYVEKELARLAKMVKSPSLKADTKAGFQLKQNILRAFAEEKKEGEEL